MATKSLLDAIGPLAKQGPYQLNRSGLRLFSDDLPYFQGDLPYFGPRRAVAAQARIRNFSREVPSWRRQYFSDRGCASRRAAGLGAYVGPAPKVNLTLPPQLHLPSMTPAQWAAAHDVEPQFPSGSAITQWSSAVGGGGGPGAPTPFVPGSGVLPTAPIVAATTGPTAPIVPATTQYSAYTGTEPVSGAWLPATQAPTPTSGDFVSAPTADQSLLTAPPFSLSDRLSTVMAGTTAGLPNTYWLYGVGALALYWMFFRKKKR